MSFFHKDKEIIVSSPLKGVVHNLSDTPDDVFTSNIIGEGIAINPTQGAICAPVTSKVEIFKTNHLLIFEPSKGVYIVIHFGVGTSLLKGKGFQRLPKCTLDKVHEGDDLVLADLDYLRENAKSLLTPIIVNNDNIKKLEILVKAGDKVDFGTPIMKITLK